MRSVRLPNPLPESERKLFDFLVNSVKHLDVRLRVAGGWVRDQILGRASDDIDICIETAEGKPYVSGEQLAQVIADATSLHPTVSKIKTNPDKSKHIETGIVKVMGYHLEFCHLRKDDYTTCSPVQRTPTVTVAQPLEDAQRRDFCCNALFYNLHTDLVEDFVGGLDDIREKRLRCPLAPLETFEDDPLRMLRGVRFAGKMGFALDQSIVDSILLGGTQTSAEILRAEAAAGAPPQQRPQHVGRGSLSVVVRDKKDSGNDDDAAATAAAAPAIRFHPNVNEPFFTHESASVKIRPLIWELLRKVSRERCGIECNKMFCGPNPLYCAELLFRLELLYSAVFIEMHPVKSRKPLVSPTYEKIVMLLPPSAWGECFRRTVPLLKAALQVETHVGSSDRLVSSLVAMLTVPILGGCGNSGSQGSTATSNGVSERGQQQQQTVDNNVNDDDDDAATPSLGSSREPSQQGTPGSSSCKKVNNHIVPLSRKEELIKRVEAVVQHGLKLPAKEADHCAVLIVALDILLNDDRSTTATANSAVDLAKQAVAAAQASTEDVGTTAVAKIEGPLRMRLFQAIRAAKTATHAGLASMLNVFASCAFGEGHEAAARFFTQSVQADELLWRCGTLVPLLKGDELLAPAVLPSMPRDRTADVLTAELQHMVMRRVTTDVEAMTGFLRSAFPEFTAAQQPQQQQQQRQQRSPIVAAAMPTKKKSPRKPANTDKKEEGPAAAAAAPSSSDAQRVDGN